MISNGYRVINHKYDAGWMAVKKMSFPEIACMSDKMQNKLGVWPKLH